MKLWKRNADTSAALISWLRYQFAKKIKMFHLIQDGLSNILGISRGAISNYENKRRKPNKMVRKLIISAAKKFGIKLKESDFDYDYKKTAKYNSKIKTYIDNYWKKMKKKYFLFESYHFIYEREKSYEETGRRFISSNFPFPPWIPEYKPNERCQLGNPNGLGWRK